MNGYCPRCGRALWDRLDRHAGTKACDRAAVEVAGWVPVHTLHSPTFPRVSWDALSDDLRAAGFAGTRVAKMSRWPCWPDFGGTATREVQVIPSWLAAVVAASFGNTHRTLVEWLRRLRLAPRLRARIGLAYTVGGAEAATPLVAATLRQLRRSARRRKRL